MFEFGVVDDPPLLEVDEEHLARLQAPLLDDALLGDRQHADFGGHHHQVIVGDQVARRTQAIAIERCSDLAAVGEGHGCGTVPGLHERHVVLVEGAAFLVHQRVAGPGFGDQHHHGMGQAVAAHHQQFQGIVEGCRIGLAVINQRPDLFQVFAQHRRGNSVFAGAHPVDVAAQGVDLAVVRDHAERMRQIPGREGVGGEALVGQCERRNCTLVLQIQIVSTHLIGQQHTLVHHGATGHRRHVEHLAVGQLECLDAVADRLAQDVELALQRVSTVDTAAAGDEYLAYHRFEVPGRLSEARVIHRHVAPAQQNLTFVANRAFDDRLASTPTGVSTRQEHHADTILAWRREGHALVGHFLAQEYIRNLNQNAGTVS